MRCTSADEFMTTARKVGLALWMVVILAPCVGAQSCGLTRGSSSACLTLEWVRTLTSLQRSENDTREDLKGNKDPISSAFYGIKSRRRAGELAIVHLEDYRGSPDDRTAKSAAFLLDVVSWLMTKDSSKEVTLRRVANYEVSLAELQEMRAAQKVQGEQFLSLLIAATGEVVSASLVIEPDAQHVTKRSMTVVARNAIVAEIDRSFSKHARVERDGFWSSGYAAAAAALRENLLDKGWTYLP